jgi:acetyl esterase/lipase
MLAVVLFVGCTQPKLDVSNSSAAGSTKDKQTLAEARKGFTTKDIKATAPYGPLPEPPAGVFSKTKFKAPVGELSAYVTPDPRDGKKHPAIIWITGGDCNSVDDSIWRNAPASNDQTASAFRKAGVVMMFPSLRGGNDNPGKREGFFGEVDDIVAAADFLAKQDYVDARRIYLGGHSTGGTLVLLTCECSNRFRAVFSFGPAADVSFYPPEYTPFNTTDKREVELRSPVHWLHGIKSPVFVLEGAVGGNTRDLELMKETSKNAQVHFFSVAGANHFSILAPTTRLLAEKILADTGEQCNISLTNQELNALFGK